MNEDQTLLLRQRIERAQALETLRQGETVDQVDQQLINEQIRLKAAMFDASGQWLEVFHQSIAQAIRDVLAEAPPKSQLPVWMIGGLAFFYISFIAALTFVRGFYNIMEGKEFLEWYVLSSMVITPFAVALVFKRSLIELWRSRSK